MHDAVPTREIVNDASVFRHSADGADLILRQLRRWPGKRAVAHFISLVLLMRGPSQIVRVGIISATIAVRNLMLGARRWTVERFTDNAMDKALHLLLFVPESERWVAVENPGLHDLARPRSVTRHNPHYRAIAVNDIFWRIGNDAAIIGGIIRVSHGALLSRCGQGRALVEQRFRPAFSRRFPTKMQLLEAA